jgi:hypothetical protein
MGEGRLEELTGGGFIRSTGGRSQVLAVGRSGAAAGAKPR